jgi:hypothetical protein
MLDTVIERRSRGIKEWEFKERAGMGQEMLSGSRPVEAREAGHTYMEYGLSPPGRIQSRGNRQMAKNQVHCTPIVIGEGCYRW